MTIAFPKTAEKWYKEARKLHENEKLDNIHAIISPVAPVRKAPWLERFDFLGLSLLFWSIRNQIKLMDGQFPLLESFFEKSAEQHNTADVVVHDFTYPAGRVLCQEYDVPCIELNVMINTDRAFMGWWRPPTGMAVSSFDPPSGVAW